MAKVYIETISSSLYSRTIWSDSGATTYVPGDRVSLSDSLFVHGGGTIDNSHNRIYVCIADNNSTTYPFDDPTNWALAGSSEEYPCFAVDGSICTSGINNEVYLEHEASRYSGNGSNRFTWNQATAQGTEHGELIFADGEYNDDSKGFTIERLNLTAKNTSKVSITTVGHYQNIFQGNIVSAPETTDISTQTGIKFIVGGTKTLFHTQSALAFDSCVITDRDSSAGTYSPASFRLGDNGNFLNLKNTLIDLPNTTIALMGYNMALFKGQKSAWENSTIYTSAGSGNQYLPMFYGNNSNISVKKCIFAFVTSVYSVDNWTLGFPNDSSENLVYVYDQSAKQPGGEAGVIIQDPLFVDRGIGDFRLRPSSPLIGGLKNSTKQSEIESQYPQGKWFDSNAAAGGDGNWDTPYNNYGEAIDSFTGNEAVILIKEGQHSLQQGYWNGTSWGMGNDLLKTYSGGIKFIGMGPGSVFTSDSGVINYCAFWSQTNISNPNSRDTPFLFKDFDILLNNSGFVGRGLIGARRAEYININVNQAENLGMINSNLFDYMHQSGSNDSGEYLKMTGCTINVSQTGLGSATNHIVGSSGGMKQFSGCTFADLNRTTSTNGAAPVSFSNYSFGSYPGSYIKDCIIYSRTSNTLNSTMSSNLEVKNCAVYSTEGSVSINSNYGGALKELDPKFVATEPHDFDLRLRPDSPLIGGLKVEPSNVYYLQPGNPYNGDGSQKDASAMTADGEPGPFNAFKNIVAAGVAYGSKIIIIEGTYPWPAEFHTQKTSSNWEDYTYEGYSYHAETTNKVIFDASNQGKCLGHYTLGGAAGSGTHIDLHTSFNGIQFNRSFKAQAWPHNTTAIYSTTDTLGKGSLTFNSCQFLGWIQSNNYNLTGGSRSGPNSSIHWSSCVISIAFENDGGSLFGGQDRLADDNLSTNWSWTNCVFYSPHGETTFYGNNAPNGTYFGPSQIFGSSGMQSSRIFKGNVLYVPGGTTTIAGTNTIGKWPQIKNNALIGVDIDANEQSVLDANNNLINIDPLFVDPSNDNFSLRPLSPLIGQG